MARQPMSKTFALKNGCCRYCLRTLTKADKDKGWYATGICDMCRADRHLTVVEERPKDDLGADG